MNIGSGNGYPASALSNFAPHSFVFDGVQCNSLEGLLQSLKFSSPEMQRHICTLVGYAAKKAGKNKNWRVKRLLYWKGQPIKRDEKEYQVFLDAIYNAVYAQNESFRKALKATGNATLTHSIGRTSESETILTQREFCSRLTKLRDNGKL